MRYRLRPIAATGVDYNYDFVNPVKHGGDCATNPLRLVLGDDKAGNWQYVRAAACSGCRSISCYRKSNLSTEYTHSRNPPQKARSTHFAYAEQTASINFHKEFSIQVNDVQDLFGKDVKKPHFNERPHTSRLSNDTQPSNPLRSLSGCDLQAKLVPSFGMTCMRSCIGRSWETTWRAAAF
jgi:hypothetical protein